jgi:hypothetical protein
VYFVLKEFSLEKVCPRPIMEKINSVLGSVIFHKKTEKTKQSPCKGNTLYTVKWWGNGVAEGSEAPYTGSNRGRGGVFAADPADGQCAGGVGGVPLWGENPAGGRYA